MTEALHERIMSAASLRQRLEDTMGDDRRRCFETEYDYEAILFQLCASIGDDNMRVEVWSSVDKLLKHLAKTRLNQDSAGAAEHLEDMMRQMEEGKRDQQHKNVSGIIEQIVVLFRVYMKHLLGGEDGDDIEVVLEQFDTKGSPMLSLYRIVHDCHSNDRNSACSLDVVVKLLFGCVTAFVSLIAWRDPTAANSLRHCLTNTHLRTRVLRCMPSL